MIWDADIIERRLDRDFDNSQQRYLAALAERLPPYADAGVCHNLATEQCIQKWASDSASLACRYAYVDEKARNVTTGFHMCAYYYDFALPVIEQQLLLGAVRLAYLLEHAFGCNPILQTWLVDFQ